MTSLRVIVAVFLLAVAGLIVRSAVAVQPASPGRAESLNVRLSRRITLEGEGGWDYLVADSEKGLALDAARREVYLVTAELGPRPSGAPAGSRPPMLPGTFTLLVVSY